MYQLISQSDGASDGPANAVRCMRRRCGLTLVELMVTISIIAILAGLFLGALSNAANEAKAMKSRSMVVKLNNLIMPRYEAYRTRRVPIQIQSPPTTASGGKQYPQMVGQLRLNALHDLMRLEMPDRMTDIIDGPVTPQSYTYSFSTGSFAPSPSLIPRPSLSQSYYQAIVNATGSATPTLSMINLTNQGAECLYMIVSLGIVDELGGRDLFNESSIGDTDNDHLPEFIDAWGTPIGFLRWAPGFTISELQGAGGTIHTPGTTSLIANGSVTEFHSYGLSSRNNAYAGKTITVYTPTGPVTQSATIASSTYDTTTGQTTLYFTGTGLAHMPSTGDTFGIDPDPFDPIRGYPAGSMGALGATNAVPFALYPLIYSAGQDKTFGIISDFSSTVHYTSYSQYPFLYDNTGGSQHGQQIGTTSDITGEQNSVSGWQPNGWTDNIHNHLIGLR